MGGGYMPGQAGTTLGYEYEPPRGGYDADAGWNGWELARAQYGGGSRRGTQGRGFERDWFDGIVSVDELIRTCAYLIIKLLDARSIPSHHTLQIVDLPSLKQGKPIDECTTYKNRNDAALTTLPRERSAYGSHPGMMQQQGMGMGMGLGMMGPGVMGMGGQGGIAYPPSAGQMMENQMLAQHQAMHGQAVPGMSPEFAHRMDGEGPIPGTKQYTDALAYSGGGGGMQGQGYPLVGQMGGSGQHGYGYGGGMGGAGMYGQPRGSWYGR
ncbi:hypothetical protein QFC19_003704 [Naganishia cerealis]|uniref:Uncharacterized protein n=1 Tax=Naganishia cerealis TaxID=610337 RepID=A0ACC2W1U9_9TREE|nr:hypothetical protein QFC19_003704 [Naganishia cerealis]